MSSVLLANRGNVLGNTIHLANLKLLVVGGLMKCRSSVRFPLCCNLSGEDTMHFKHEEEGASPKMAKRLEDMLGRST